LQDPRYVAEPSIKYGHGLGHFDDERRQVFTLKTGSKLEQTSLLISTGALGILTFRLALLPGGRPRDRR
jgi:hypothetical protein